MSGDVSEEFKALVERSSLGTPEAKAARASVPPEAAARVVERSKEIGLAEAMAASGAPWWLAKEAIASTALDREVGTCTLNEVESPVHACPPGDEALMPCCGRTPFEVPRWHRMATDPDLVTCQGRPT